MATPLQSTSPRPPTPPKKNIDNVITDALRYLDSAHDTTGQSSLATPPTSSPAATAKESASYFPSTKRIRFDAVPTLCEGDLSYKDGIRARDPPPSRLSRSPKSILKPLNPNPQLCSSETDLSDTSPHKPTDMSEMLEQTIKQLAGPGQAQRLDAYRMLVNHMRIFKDQPDHNILSKKLPLLQDFIKRDITGYKQDESMASRTLALQAVKLCSVLLMDRHRLNITVDFRRWLIEDCLSLLSNPYPDKELAKNQLYLLTMPSICELGLSSDIVSSIVQNLSTIHLRVSGTSIQSLRLMILAQLVEKQSSSMLASIRVWLPHVIHGFLSRAVDIQKNATVLGQRAATTLGSSKSASQALVDFLELETKDKRTNYNILRDRLYHMFRASCDEAFEVPKIWIVVITLLRGSRQHLEYWKRLVDWLHLLQHGFNAGNPSLNLKSLVAWNQFIVALRPDLHTRTDIKRLLCIPVFGILQRRGTKQTSRVKEAAWSSYYLILFYGFHPGTTKGQWLDAWKHYVDGAVKSCCRRGKWHANVLCTALASMLFHSNARIWNESLVQAKSIAPVRLDDIPRLNSQWVRKHLPGHLLPSLVDLISYDMKSDDISSDEDLIGGLWGSLLGAIKEACNREVQTSPETMNAIKGVIGSLLCLYERLPHILVRLSATTFKGSVRTAWKLAELSLESFGMGIARQPAASFLPELAGACGDETLLFHVFKRFTRAIRATHDIGLSWDSNDILRTCMQSSTCAVTLVQWFKEAEPGFVSRNDSTSVAEDIMEYVSSVTITKDQGVLLGEPSHDQDHQAELVPTKADGAYSIADTALPADIQDPAITKQPGVNVPSCMASDALQLGLDGNTECRELICNHLGSNASSSDDDHHHTGTFREANKEGFTSSPSSQREIPHHQKSLLAAEKGGHRELETATEDITSDKAISRDDAKPEVLGSTLTGNACSSPAPAIEIPDECANNEYALTDTGPVKEIPETFDSSRVKDSFVPKTLVVEIATAQTEDVEKNPTEQISEKEFTRWSFESANTIHELSSSPPQTHTAQVLVPHTSTPEANVIEAAEDKEMRRVERGKRGSKRKQTGQESARSKRTCISDHADQSPPVHEDSEAQTSSKKKQQLKDVFNLQQPTAESPSVWQIMQESQQPTSSRRTRGKPKPRSDSPAPIPTQSKRSARSKTPANNDGTPSHPNQGSMLRRSLSVANETESPKGQSSRGISRTRRRSEGSRLRPHPPLSLKRKALAMEASCGDGQDSASNGVEGHSGKSSHSRRHRTTATPWNHSPELENPTSRSQAPNQDNTTAATSTPKASRGKKSKPPTHSSSPIQPSSSPENVEASRRPRRQTRRPRNYPDEEEDEPQHTVLGSKRLKRTKTVPPTSHQSSPDLLKPEPTSPANSSAQNRKTDPKCTPSFDPHLTPEPPPPEPEGRSTSPTSMSQAARSVRDKLKDLFQDVKRLFLGAPELRDERGEVEDAFEEVGRELREAGRR